MSLPQTSEISLHDDLPFCLQTVNISEYSSPWQWEAEQRAALQGHRVEGFLENRKFHHPCGEGAMGL
jgi:hypothetical protein